MKINIESVNLSVFSAFVLTRLRSNGSFCTAPVYGQVLSKARDFLARREKINLSWTW